MLDWSLPPAMQLRFETQLRGKHGWYPVARHIDLDDAVAALDVVGSIPARIYDTHHCAIVFEEGESWSR